MHEETFVMDENREGSGCILHILQKVSETLQLYIFSLRRSSSSHCRTIPTNTATTNVPAVGVNIYVLRPRA